MAQLQRLKDLIESGNDIEKSLLHILGINPKLDQDLYEEIVEVVSIICKDRDGNGKFDLEDLKLLGTDIQGIVSLVTSLIFTISKIPGFIKSREPEDIENFTLNLLVYIFLVIVPEETKSSLSRDEKEDILELSYTIYQMVRSLSVVKNALNKAWKYIKSGCCKGPDVKGLDTKIQEHHIEIMAAKDRVEVKRTVSTLNRAVSKKKK